jgi:FAD/FMN-containing dehydrogenase
VSLFAAFRRGRGLSAITGPVLRPADPGYAAELAAFNTAFPLRPGLVVGATSEADVVAAVAMAAADGLPLATKGTGHGVTAEITAPVLVSTRRLDAVTVDARSRTARVGAGATWRRW